jgi:hypothetical protein
MAAMHAGSRHEQDRPAFWKNADTHLQGAHFRGEETQLADVMLGRGAKGRRG